MTTETPQPQLKVSHDELVSFTLPETFTTTPKPPYNLHKDFESVTVLKETSEMAKGFVLIQTTINEDRDPYWLVTEFHNDGDYQRRRACYGTDDPKTAIENINRATSNVEEHTIPAITPEKARIVFNSQSELKDCS